MRIATFCVPPEHDRIHAELRALANEEPGRPRWIGRRLLPPRGAEVASVTVWDVPAEAMQWSTLRDRFSAELQADVVETRVELYTCRAYGAWSRQEAPCLLRVFRGRLTEGEADAFDDAAAAAYVRLFESNPSCGAIVAGISGEGDIALVTLWTSWDAVVTATGGDLSRVLPVTLPGWAIDGSATHYELVAAVGR